MPVLVGDLIQAAREAMPDRSGTLPNATSTVAVSTPPSSTLPTGTYFVYVTQRNPWGETMGAESAQQTITAGQALQITSPLMPGATTIRAYITNPGGVSGTETQFVESTSSPFLISAPPVNAGLPPNRNSAYNPDTDGNAVSCSVLYRWVNDGLKAISRLVGGILDYSGVGTQPGQPLYVCTGQWIDVSDVWYNGYWIKGGKRGDFFRRNTVTSSVLNNVACSVMDDRVILEVSYQPDRTAGVTTTTADMSNTATSVGITNTGFALLPFGFAQIGSEVVAYSSLASGAMSGLIRRLSGTSAQAWPSGTTVKELNLFFCGKRILDPGYYPGQALIAIPFQAGLDVILTTYILSRYRDAEQDFKEAQARRQEFQQMAKDWVPTKAIEKGVQVGGDGSTYVYNWTVAGGLVLPS